MHAKTSLRRLTHLDDVRHRENVFGPLPHTRPAGVGADVDGGALLVAGEAGPAEERVEKGRKEPRGEKET